MEIIIDNQDMRETFKGLLNENYFIDKSNIINDFNKLIDKNSEKYVFIRKPRRFGKTSIAAMLVTYYKKEYEIKQYKEFQGKFHTLYLDLSSNVFSFKNLRSFISSINSKLKIDIEELNPNSKVLKEYDDDIVVNLQNLYLETDKKFILVIDEWDYIITNKKFTDKERNYYINFLTYLFKDNSYLAFVYMTGITAIAKELSKSSLNYFKEYTMLNDKKYFEYFGFTEEEVHKLCEKYKNLSFENLESWYNGYKSSNGSFKVVKRMINYDIVGVKEEILELINGNKIEIKLENYGVEDIRKESKEKEHVKEILYSKK
ncbi:hypothetical protein LY90DRAFT_518179 [Neocallimastix californiae]|uniref:AAA-ATPase-like domain-containing protein n=1 Tax=Neocallimastix californiae TaxID=1754190 RepID=A0A1Y1ZT94_9FUNG|nr:hypothetical protein LY90DRAFT_518179 [Neocallimastix californiae]|eukprot:ORY13448.1 hypothetical protein LY90DRAFT_518179 [Neocallimastix californiae]